MENRVLPFSYVAGAHFLYTTARAIAAARAQSSRSRLYDMDSMFLKQLHDR